jgi:hypothetical protein
MHDVLSQIPFPVVLLIVAGLVVLAVALAYKVEDKLIAKRKQAAKLGKLMARYGHTIASNAFQDFAVGDVADGLKEIEKTLEKLLEPSTGPALFQADLLSQLAAQLPMPGAAPAILKAVASFVSNPANAALAKAAGLAIVAVA